jgi:hypothetical protein
MKRTGTAFMGELELEKCVGLGLELLSLFSQSSEMEEEEKKGEEEEKEEREEEEEEEEEGK